MKFAARHCRLSIARQNSPSERPVELRSLLGSSRSKSLRSTVLTISRSATATLPATVLASSSCNVKSITLGKVSLSCLATYL